VGELETRRTTGAPSSHPRLHLVARHRRAVTVLIVEDDGILRELLQRALDGYGFSVHSADGTEALRCSQQHEGTIDVLVSDIVMPGLGVVELSQRISCSTPRNEVVVHNGLWRSVPRIA
jgi:two-component system, cell cycle sensor histidine kinase and response regulator CckA